MKADKSIALAILNFILKVWVYSSLHLQIRNPFSYRNDVKLEKPFEPKYMNYLCVYILTAIFYGLYI